MRNRGGFVKRYMTVPEVASYFSVSKSLVYEWCHTGKLQVWHPDGRPGTRGLRVLSESVVQLESAGRIAAESYDE